MTIGHGDVAEAIGRGSFPTDRSTKELPLQSIVTGWISNTVPRTITEYGADSTDELILDLTVDLYDRWLWRINGGGANSFSTPAGTYGKSTDPGYPSKATMEKHGLSVKEDASVQLYFLNGD